MRCGGYIGIMTRSSNCPPCTCPQITITLNKTLVDLGTKIKIDVSIGNTTANCNYISYSLTQGGQVGSTSFNHSQLSYETIVRDVGEYEVSVEAGFEGGKKETSRAGLYHDGRGILSDENDSCNSEKNEGRKQ